MKGAALQAARLLTIESRRSVGLTLFLPLLVLAGFYLWRSPMRDITLIWVETSVAVRNTVFFVGPGIAGAAAWMAARERHRRIEELLATMPQPATIRLLATWAGVALWGALIYVAVGTGLLVATARQAVWGQPVAWVMVVGLLGMLAHTALGFAAGRCIPGRLTAPLVAVTLYFLQLLVGYSGFGPARLASDEQRAWLPYLSPVVEIGRSVWYGITPNVGVPQSTFLLGLIALALGGVALRERRTVATWSTCGVGAALILGGVVMLQQAVPDGSAGVQRSQYQDDPRAGLIPYTLVCSDDPLPVCVHPAYTPRLEEDAALINRLAAPLLDLPGAPTRAEQWSPLWRDAPADTLLLSYQPDLHTFALVVANALVVDSRSITAINDTSNCPDAIRPYSCSMAQAAIAHWLVHQANLPPDPRAQYADDRFETVAVANRFAALPPEQQRPWLAANLVALREERVPISALP